MCRSLIVSVPDFTHTTLGSARRKEIHVKNRKNKYTTVFFETLSYKRHLCLGPEVRTPVAEEGSNRSHESCRLPRDIYELIRVHL